VLLPEEDGKSHINVYSQGKTKLGQFLTNFALAPFSLPDHGKFNSVEALWYWLGCRHPDRDSLKPLHGFAAKKRGRELGAPDWVEDDLFKRTIKRAIYNKVFSNIGMAIELKNSSLPLVHYYNYKGKVVEPEDGRWVIEFLTELRTRLNNCSNLELRKLDLFKAPPGVCLAQSCNTVGSWGAGIAREFKARFPETYQQQLSLCESYSNKSQLLGNSHLNKENGYSVASLFVSSGYGKSKSNEEDILKFTGSAVSQLLNDPVINEVWIPKINSGLFGVDWEKTEIALKGILIARPIKKIVVCCQET